MPPNNRPPQGYFSTPAKGYVGVPEDEFEKKYGPTPAGKTVIGMSGNKPIYGNEGEDVAVAERKRWEEKYGKIDPNKTLIGTRDNKNLYEGDPNTGGGYTPTPEENSAVFQELENTGGGGYNPNKDPINSEKRQILADAVRDFAFADVSGSVETADSLAAQGEKLGITRKELSNAYNFYKRQGYKTTKLDGTVVNIPPAGTPATTPAATPAPMGVEEGPVMGRTPDSTPPSYFQTPSGADTTPATTAQDSGPATPRLDRLAAMQGTPMGSVSIGAKGVQGATGGLAKGPSRTGGTPIGRGIGIGASPFGSRSSAARQMNAITGANLFRAEQERLQQQEQQNLENERIRAEIDAYKKANRPPEYTKQPAFENANEKIPLFLRR